MKSLKFLLIIFTLIGLTGFISCIQEEAANSEADITKAYVENIALKDNPIIENRNVIFYVGKDADCSNLAPVFELTPGATISPKSGTYRDFSDPQTYIVTSEDGRWTKEYNVSFIETGFKERYEFDVIIPDEDNGFDVFIDDNMRWASGNKGYALVANNGAPNTYPTYQINEGEDGKSVCLVTRDTKAFGAMMNRPIAAGSIFMGSFEINLAKPAESTKVGLAIDREPVMISGRFKYKAGTDYKEGNATVSGKKDQFDIYAVFYERDDQVSSLTGANAKTHENIISFAQVDNTIETDEWVEFSIPMERKNNKTVDIQKLLDGHTYKFGIVCSSSIHGDDFKGAIGSTLIIDRLDVKYKEY